MSFNLYIHLQLPSRVKASLMITHRFQLHQLLDAIELIRSRKEGVLKVMIQCDEGGDA